MPTELAAPVLSSTPMLRCSTCGELLPQDDDNFYRRHDRPRGFTYSCKICTREYNNEHRNPESVEVTFSNVDDRLQVDPVVDVIRASVAIYGSVSAIARDLKVNSRSLRSLVLGYSIKNGKKYPIKSITISKADYILMSLGSSIEEAYGDV
jgi:hypothetical protein